MLTLGPLAFTAPWILAGLVLLPLLWWLLKVTPPAPRRIDFPPVRILMELTQREETPQKTPLWLLLLRLTLAALVVLALAHPLINPGNRLAGSGPLLLVVDDGWQAARDWPARVQVLADLVEEAGRTARPVLLMTTAPTAQGAEVKREPMAAAEARTAIQTLEPKPWPVDRAAAARAIDALGLSPPLELVWLSDGIEDGGALALADRLARLGEFHYYAEAPEKLARALLPPVVEGQAFRVRALRTGASGEETLSLRASAEGGRALAQAELRFVAGETTAEAVLDLPIELRNRLTRLEIENEGSAGAVVLLDERWRRRPVGLVAGGALETAQPLLSDLYYLARALKPFSDVRSGTIAELLERRLAVLVLADIGRIVGPERAALEDWLERGGVLLRFAGPRLAESVDDLTPVRLRSGGRTLGGALSWAQPARLAAFREHSPFFGLEAPDEVVVRRQVLAEPALDLGAKTWAALVDGTPLVTAERRGQGWLVLFHTTANTTWTNLPISGLFVDMLNRIVRLSLGVRGEESDVALRPLMVLDAFGRPSEDTAGARSIAAGRFADSAVGPSHPPGFYGTEGSRRALNLSAGLTELVAIEGLPPGIERHGYGQAGELDLKPWLLLAAVLLGLVDLVVSLGLRGLIPLPLRSGAAFLALAVLALPAPQARAQSGDDAFALAATLETRLAYVITGREEVDAMSRAGLVGLTRMLTRRTSVEPGPPMGADVESDDLVFFPLLYWPIVPEQPALSARALAKLDAYMKNGGTIVFDTRDQESAVLMGPNRVGPGTRRLRRLLRRLDIAPLIPVPQDHVLTKAFYLLQTFPGRWAGGEVWVERHSGGVNDGVSSIVIGGNDWASAWAMDDEGRPLAAVVPGGSRQRETAIRFGINLVMYTLTGNYKADQVHVPAILERLGQ